MHKKVVTQRLDIEVEDLQPNAHTDHKLLLIVISGVAGHILNVRYGRTVHRLQRHGHGAIDFRQQPAARRFDDLMVVES